ncbi:MAG: nucleotidyltransferase substrate binding protein [Desulfobacterium sp.]|jgi:nucleotidyltransferase substrate binding protein (TIGR01987 family)|nr:nucleotidyltransferase substrate binding protein [Desulfobacterium sp.]
MNDNTKDVRWRQRFQNFEKAYKQLKISVLQVHGLSDLEKEGMVQRFEYTFELAWKTLKDYLEAQQVDAKFPREVIKQAFHYEIIEDGEIWMDMLEKRNLMAHTYEEKIFRMAVDNISTKYFNAISQVYDFLQKKSCSA